jgi:DNA-binding MarR family transcriptional regulator
MAEFDLKSSHVSCLYYIYKSEALTAKELCEICKEDKANISRTIKYLETSGYILCEAQSNRKYHSHLKLTELGKAYCEEIFN